MPTQHVYTLEPGRPTPGRVNLLRPPIAFHVGAGILTSFPSATTLVLALGADSPCADARGAGNLGLSATRPFTWFIATHVSIRTSDTSSSPHEPPSQAYGTLSYHPSSPLSALRLRATTRLCRRLRASRAKHPARMMPWHRASAGKPIGHAWLRARARSVCRVMRPTRLKDCSNPQLRCTV